MRQQNRQTKYRFDESWMNVQAIGLALGTALISTAAAAQPRPSTVEMTCAEGARVVASRGAIVLGTGGFTFDRFVSDRRFCAINQTTEPAWAPVRDNPQCFIGYRCKEPNSEPHGDRF
jgi:hypothetical protein